MRLKTNPDLCARMLLKHGQMRDPNVYHNLWWSFNYGGVAFGHGDLDRDDMVHILDYVGHPSHEVPIIFTGWNEFHGGKWQNTAYPMVHISLKGGITLPHREAIMKIMEKTKV